MGENIHETRRFEQKTKSIERLPSRVRTLPLTILDCILPNQLIDVFSYPLREEESAGCDGSAQEEVGWLSNTVVTL